MGHRLVLLRHAKSDWSTGLADADRPLADRGRRQAPEAGRWLRSHLPGIDLAVVSPANRARSTWELVAAELDDPPTARTVDDLYSYSAGPLLHVLRELPEEAGTVVVVGHNPALEELAELLTGELVPMPTSSLAVLEVDGAWAHLGADGATLLAAGRPPSTGSGRSGTQSR